MVKDDFYEVNVQNAEEATVCVYDLHPHLWYDWGNVIIDFKELKMIEESALIWISKEDKFDSTKGVIKVGLVSNAKIPVDLIEYEKVRLIFTTKTLNQIKFEAQFKRKDIIGTIEEKKIIVETETKYMSIILTTIGLFIAGMGIIMILSYLCSSKKPAPLDTY